MRDVRRSGVAGGPFCVWLAALVSSAKRLPPAQRVASALILALALVGCAGPPFGPPTATFDAQGCVENALRRQPDPTAVEAARVTFGEKCDAGHADACSALGVMNELGVGGVVDPARALALYSRACSFGNVHGCTNLAVARIEGKGGLYEPRLAARTLESACDLGEARACLYLARLHDAGDGTSRDRALAARLFEVACDGEQAPACVARADRLARAGRRASASEFYGKACSLGDARACAYGTGDASSSSLRR